MTPLSPTTLTSNISSIHGKYQTPETFKYLKYSVRVRQTLYQGLTTKAIGHQIKSYLFPYISLIGETKTSL